jgi:uncharacterized protein (DUF4415 family)
VTADETKEKSYEKLEDREIELLHTTKTALCGVPWELNLDADVLAWFRGMGRGYQWEINRTLRRVMEEEAKVREG